MKSGRGLILITLLFFSQLIIFGQSTSASETKRFGYEIEFGISISNFNPLHQYPYLLNQPNNTPVRIGGGLYFGNFKKVFWNPFFNSSMVSDKAKTGTVNGYSVNVTSTQVSLGLLAGYSIYEKENLNLSILAGPSYALGVLNSKANGKNKINADTSFFYERSLISSFPVFVGMMLNCGKLKSFQTTHLDFMIKAGYSFQIVNPIWSYNFSHQTVRDNGADKSVNLGGFYFSIGVNLWTIK